MSELAIFIATFMLVLSLINLVVILIDKIKK